MILKPPNGQRLPVLPPFLDNDTALKCLAVHLELGSDVAYAGDVIDIHLAVRYDSYGHREKREPVHGSFAVHDFDISPIQILLVEQLDYAFIELLDDAIGDVIATFRLLSSSARATARSLFASWTLSRGKSAQR